MDLVVETGELSTKEVQDLRQDREVLGVVPAMPLRLVAPSSPRMPTPSLSRLTTPPPGV
ncbi:hypothetical protein [Actinoplanes sp. TBRC 11911]|uniref:hypothetical protein n=1 Tax=Actinoplanes sp. TBRC 11911 TaxID=2729386 RepID=UPI001B7D4DAE|nr:hypothetical protein [Actinoplanes sp. TBRC 11911]